MRRLLTWCGIVILLMLLASCSAGSDSTTAGPQPESMPAGSETVSESESGRPKFVEFYADW